MSYNTELLGRIPSALGGYDIGVITYGPVQHRLQAMMEMTTNDYPRHAFSVSFADQIRRRVEPLPITKHPARILCDAHNAVAGKVVIAGLGAGLVHEQVMLHGLPDVVSIEADQSVMEMAKRHWDFQGQVVVQTIEWAMENYFADASISAVFLNHYSKLHNVTPHGSGKDFMDLVLRRLKPRGTIVLNAFGYDSQADIDELMRFGEDNDLLVGVTQVVYDSGSSMNSFVTLRSQ